MRTGPRHLSAGGPSQIPTPRPRTSLDGQHHSCASAPSDYSFAGRCTDAL